MRFVGSRDGSSSLGGRSSSCRSFGLTSEGRMLERDEYGNITVSDTYVGSKRLSPLRLRLPNCIPTFSTEPKELGITTG